MNRLHAPVALALSVTLAGCGVTSLAMRAADVGYGEHVPSTSPVGIDKAPAHHAIVGWSGLSLSCGRVTELETTTDHYAWTTVTKVIMGFFAVSEAAGGAAMLLTDSTQSAKTFGAVLLGDAALALGAAILFKQRHYRDSYRTYGLAYRCDERDGIAVGGRVVPMSTGLTTEERAVVLDEIAQGKPLRIVVDRKVLAIPPDAVERCAVLGLERAAADPSCASTVGQDAGSVLVTLGRAAAIVRMPLVTPPPPPPSYGSTTTPGTP